MTPEQPTPDYGEPWEVDSARGVRDESGWIICYPFGSKEEEQKMAGRIVACVNACAGMTDPANEIQSLREKLRQAEEAFQKIIRSVPCCVNGFWFWPNISPDGDYLGEIPTDPASSMQEMQEIAESALAKLQNTQTPCSPT